MARHNSVSRLLSQIRKGEEAFSMVEAMVAVTILLIAIMMSMQPLMSAMLRISDARILTVAENLAQAEIEAIRSLPYQDVGSEGYTPSGVLERSRIETIEGRDYQVDVVVTYEGSITGLTVVEQGGDGVQGTWDPGVDYKFVQVSVTASDTSAPPVVMETLVSPGNVGAHEGIANIRITLAKYEPFEPSTLQYPSLAIQDPPALPIRSGAHTEQQVFAVIPEGDYTVSLDLAQGWVIHPEDTAAGLQQVTATVGLLTETTLRVYRPATLVATITDSATGLALPDARIRLVHNPSGAQTDYAPGEHRIEGLMPDAYDITVSATGYHDHSVTSVNIPADYPSPTHNLVVALEPIVPTSSTTSTTTTSTTTTIASSSTTSTTTTTTTLPPTTTTEPPASIVQITFIVKDNTSRAVNGATVTLQHPERGTLTVVTNAYGEAYLDLEDDTVFSATASTPWGHGPDTSTFNTKDNTNIQLKLTRPYGTGTYVLQGGSNAQFLVSSGSGWMIIPPNFNNEASFVAPSGWREVAKRCDADGSIQGDKWVYVRSGSNRATTIYGYCP